MRWLLAVVRSCGEAANFIQLLSPPPRQGLSAGGRHPSICRLAVCDFSTPKYKLCDGPDGAAAGTESTSSS